MAEGSWRVVLPLAMLALVGGVQTNWPLPQHLGWVLLLLLGVALVSALGARRLEATPSTDRLRYVVGDVAVETLTLRNRSALPVPAVWLDGAPLGPMWRDRRQEWDVPLPQRGPAYLGGGDLYVADPLGLFRLRSASVPTLSVLVYPRPIPTPAAVAAVGDLAASRHRWRLTPADASLGDLREYVAGDPPSRIHWRTTARTGRLVVADPESQRRAAVWLLVDLGGAEEDVERVAGVAAYLAEELCAGGRDIGAVVAGASHVVVPARRGADHRWNILDALARVERANTPQIEVAVRALNRVPDGGVCLLLSPVHDLRPWVRAAARSATDVRAVDVTARP